MIYGYRYADRCSSHRYWLLTGLVISLTTFPLLAQTIRYVKPTASGSGNGSSWANASANLQAMINASISGNQVWVTGGAYKPTSTTARTISFAMKNGVAIYGGFVGTETTLAQRPAINSTTPSSTTLSGEIGSPSSTTDNSFHVINNPAGLTTTATLDGFIITGGNANSFSGLDNVGGGLLNNGAGSGNVCSPTIRQCVFVANQGVYGAAINNDGSSSGLSSPVVTNCVFLSNTATNAGGSGGALLNSGTSSPLLTNCVFQGNTASGAGGAIYNVASVGGGSSSPRLINCSFQDNMAGSGGVMYNIGSPSSTCSPVLINCVLWNNGGANTFVNISATLSASYTLFEATVTGYTNLTGNMTSVTTPFGSPTSTQLASGSPAINAGDPTTTPTTGAPAAVGFTDLAGNTRFVGGRIDMGAYESCTLIAPRLYVRASASGANTGLSWADAFTDLQSALSYYCSGNLNEIWVAGGTYKPTSTTARTISFAMKNDVAIYGGFAGTETTLAQRPAINATTPSSATLSGEIGSPSSTTDNSYHVISNPPGLTTTAILDGFVITAGFANGLYPNDAGGGIVNNGSLSGNECSPLIRSCTFMANQARFGGAIDNEGQMGGTSSPVLINCVFLGNNAANKGGAMFNYGQSLGNSSPRLTNCVFQNNTAPQGGAMYNDAVSGTSSPVMTNCAFQNNIAPQGGAMYNDAVSGTSSPVMTNCVLWNNGGTNTFYTLGAMVTANYNLFETTVIGYTSGPGNLTTTTTPFASTTSTKLAPTSPAINTGDPTSTIATVGTTDLGGNPRFAQGRIDMGAFEWGTTCQGLVTSLKAGSWNDPTVWACNVVPMTSDIVQLNHVVTLPSSYTAQIQTLRNSNTGKVTYQNGAKLRLGF
ncbi:hypothetical protein IC229_32100 [Spirosoma sp. BT702]|uniref:Right-handed parallel beta-helix repeat-containing protein n=1 Tax=Spirosoma profusum TaxID=2771354 RepID=A0A927AVP9_9BACT|nr:choice-of-anchor Q domain-containing protein [Spirosoma profusum]MBD2705305.1 hypothetical protein [Spirosoma profusum]